MGGPLQIATQELVSKAKVRAAFLPHTHREVIVMYLRTGSRYETAEQSGLSHFLEHMLFRGTASHPSAHLLASAFEDLGGTLEATTGTDYGTLAIAVPPESFSETLAHLAEVVSSPLLSDLEAERNIISEEILEDQDDQGRVVHALSLGRRLAFPGHGMGRLITGPLENLQRFSVADLREHHSRTYVGQGMALSVAGPISPELALAEIERHFSGLSPGERLKDVPPPAMTGPGFEFVPHKGSSQTRIYTGLRTSGYHDAKDAALEMLLRILDDGLSTRLYHRLCDESGLCYDVQGSYEAFSDSGIVEIVADTAHERAPRVLEKILSIVSDMAEHGPLELELERARRRARWQHLAVLDDPGEIADYLGFSALSGTAEVPDLRLEELLDVTAPDIRDAAEALSRPSSRVVVAVGQQKPAVLEKLRTLAASGASH